MKNIMILALILTGPSSCSNYYQAALAPEPTKPASYKNFEDSKKYYVLRNGNESFAMKNISVSPDGKNVSCTLEQLPVEHKLHAGSTVKSKMKYRTKGYSNDDESGVLNEVHIYLMPGAVTAPGSYSLVLENVQKTEIIEKNKVKTRNSHAMGIGIGIGVGVIGAVVLGGAIFASNFSIF